jgi:hypothetical protein
MATATLCVREEREDPQQVTNVYTVVNETPVTINRFSTKLCKTLNTYNIETQYVRFEVFTAVTLKNVVFLGCDVVWLL